MQLHQFLTSEALNQAFVSRLVTILNQAIKDRGHAYMVVSGGNTPKALFQVLSEQILPWEKVTFLLADERLVPLDHPDRNEQLLQKHLLVAAAHSAKMISLYEAPSDWKSIEKKISMLPSFDAVILGMGDDGHTASIFPSSDQVERALFDESATIVVQPKHAPHQRISLTRARLMKHRNLFLHIVGEKKNQVLEEAIRENNPLRYPICAFSNDKTCHLQVMYAKSL